MNEGSFRVACPDWSGSGNEDQLGAGLGLEPVVDLLSQVGGVLGKLEGLGRKDGFGGESGPYRVIMESH